MRGWRTKRHDFFVNSSLAARCSVSFAFLLSAYRFRELGFVSHPSRVHLGTLLYASYLRTMCVCVCVWRRSCINVLNTIESAPIARCLVCTYAVLIRWFPPFQLCTMWARSVIRFVESKDSQSNPIKMLFSLVNVDKSEKTSFLFLFLELL